MLKRVVDLCLILGLTCGATFAQTTQLDSGSMADDQAKVDKAAPAFPDRHPRYRVSPSDVLSISFPLSPEINTQVTVQPDGFITLANAGSVYIQGQTVAEIAETLRRAYARTLHEPIINVDVTNFQVPQFSVIGQVGKPGQYPLRYDTTVSEAIAISGGLLHTAKTRVFVLHRVSADLMEVRKFDIKNMLQGRKLSEDIQVQPGDMIFVPETFISKFRRYLPYNSGIGVNPQALAR